MSDLVCINDTFSPEVRQVYEQYGVVTPYLDGVYSVREVVITRVGTGLLLNELVNPMIPIGEGENGFKAEPNWNVNRFRNLDGTEITQQQLKQWKTQKKDLPILENM